jgi:long-chain acyl-CoA synthetase
MATQAVQTLNELFLTAIESHRKADAFLSKSGGQYQGLSSHEALKRVAALAVALDRLGVRRGDRAAIFSDNRLEWALSDYAILGLGAIVVPIYPTLLESDLEYILRDSGSKGIVTGNDVQLQKALNIRSRLPELGFVLAMDGAASGGSGVPGWKRTVETQLKVGSGNIDFYRAKAIATRAEDTASILYTSGTMGRPKGVILTHSNIVSNILACQDLFQLGHHDVGLSFLPLSHVFERTLDYTYFWKGVSIAYAESYEALPQNLLEVQPTVVAVVPRVLEKIHERVIEVVRQAPQSRRELFYWALWVGKKCFPYRLENRTPPLRLRLGHAVADRLVFSKIRRQLGGRTQAILSGAAPLSRELAEFFYAVGLPVYEGYGLTETSPVISVNYPGHVKLGTVGPVVQGDEVKIDTQTGDAEGDAGGEILVRGPNVTQGYYRLEKENREAFVDGWFHTGDLGRLDREGFLTITGRKKNLFKTSGGKYVSPEKLENLFQGHPYVSQLLVLGEARKFVAALIVPNFARLEAYARSQGISFKDREDLIRNPQTQTFMQQQVDEITQLLPPHERIRQIGLLPKELTIESGELSTTLKIKRRVVEERCRDLIEEIYSRHAPQLQPQPP